MAKELDDIDIEFTDDEPSFKKNELEIVPDEPEEKKSLSSERESKLEKELSEIKTEFQNLRSSLNLSNRDSSNTRQSNEPDQFDKQESAVYDKQKALYAEYQAHQANKTLTAELQNQLENKAREYERELSDVRTSRSVSRIVPALQQQTRRANYEAKYPEVYQNNRAFSFAKAEFEKRVALGEPNDDVTLEKSMNEARRAFKLGGSYSPTDGDRSRMISTAGGGSKRFTVPKVILGKAERQMAKSMYMGGVDKKGNKINEDAAYKMWANGPGRRAAEKIAGKSR